MGPRTRRGRTGRGVWTGELTALRGGVCLLARSVVLLVRAVVIAVVAAALVII